MRTDATAAPSGHDFAATMVFTQAEVLAGAATVTFAYRAPRTGVWYLLAGPGRGEDVAGEMTPVEPLLALDPSIAQLAAMPPGRGARRDAVETPWQPFVVSEPKKPTIDVAAIEEEDRRAARLVIRRRRLASGAAGLATVLGIVGIVLGGFIVLSVRRPEPIAGMPAHIALAAPAIAIGLWLLACGFRIGARMRAPAAVVAALPLLALVAMAALRSDHPGPVVELVTSAWPNLVPDAWLRWATMRWNTLCADEVLLGLASLDLLRRGLGLAMVARRMRD